MKAVWVLLLASGLVCVNAKSMRIYGGDVTTIDQYPTIVAMLITVDMSSYFHDCGGTIINTRSILSAAHCFRDPSRPVLHRVRVGSTWANSGGTVHGVISILNHPLYTVMSPIDSDISIVRTASDITYINNAVQPGTFAGPNYNTGDNSVVWAAGWGRTETGFASEQLRHVQLLTVNHELCRQRIGFIITDNMLCVGWLGIGGRDQCSGDSGGPLYHNGVVVGVCSFGDPACNSDYFPGVNVRVSRFIDWIQANA